MKDEEFLVKDEEFWLHLHEDAMLRHVLLAVMPGRNVSGFGRGKQLQSGADAKYAVKKLSVVYIIIIFADINEW